MTARPVPKWQWKRMAESYGVEFADVDGVRALEGGSVQFRLKDGSIVERLNSNTVPLDGRTQESAVRTNEAGGNDRPFIEAMKNS